MQILLMLTVTLLPSIMALTAGALIRLNHLRCQDVVRLMYQITMDLVATRFVFSSLSLEVSSLHVT